MCDINDGRHRVPPSFFVFVFFFGFFRCSHAEAPLSVLAFWLIAARARLSEAVEVAFFYLFPVNDRRNDHSETLIAKGRTDILWPPRKDRVFFPLFPTFHTFNAQFVHRMHL